jgi:two-component system chemotaxis sensor kinase CheA
MDISEYLPMFLAESREHLQELSLAVVRIEERPDDRETIDEIFRIAHSLKGMSATMGFEKMAALTHSMEDVFELLRHRKEGLSHAAIDVLLQCVDVLEATVEHIEVDGEEKLDPEHLIARLQGLTRKEAEADEPEATAFVAPPVEEGVVHIVARLSAEALMPSVRAFMVLAAASDNARVLASVPAEDAVDGFDGSVVEVWVETEEPEPVKAAIANVPDVAAVTIVGAEEAEAVEDEPVSEEQPAPAAETAPPAPVVAAPAEAPKVEAPKAEAPKVDAPKDEAPKEQARGGAPRKASGTVRVDAERLDQLMHHMAELVVQRTHVEALAGQADIPGLQQAMQELTRCSHALQHMVMQVRMIPVEAVFLRFPRLVRDLSSRLGKEVDLELVGQDTELDRTVVDAIGDPLMHLVRNALDHGLEPPEERVASGKPQRGRLVISARHAGGSVVIGVLDDGRGIDPLRVARKAAERGLIDPSQIDSVDAAKACELVFAPGFSTAEQMSDVSGRGVGMDAVRAKVRELGGEVSLTSTPGSGSRIEIRLPLTLAILSALLVRSAGGTFAVPLDRIDRTVRLADHVVKSMRGAPVLMLDGLVVPIVDGAEALARESVSAGEFGVLLRGGNDETVALRVDGLVGQRELVARPLPDELATSAAVSGAAVLSDGDIALIVDPDALSSAHAVPGTTAATS